MRRDKAASSPHSRNVLFIATAAHGTLLPMIVRPVADGVEVLAPAKLNLFLEVLGRRPDGYHEVETLMVAVDLFDRLTFRDDPSGEITLRCDDPGLPTGSENLVVRAAERLRDESGRRLGAHIDLHKSIPAGAGLAGGSSDAAADAGGPGSALGPADPPERLDALAGETRQRRAVLPEGRGRHLPRPRASASRKSRSRRRSISS